MTKRSQRSYRSPRREEQAEQTKRRIEDAARRLFTGKGYEATRIEEIARKAGVATPTVYAIFKSKRGIMEGLIERSAFPPSYAALVQQALESPDPEERMHYVARIARGIYDALRSQSEMMRGAIAIAPALMREKERMRFERQARMIGFLARRKALRPGISAAAARDILWTLTGSEIYRNLVVDRGWGPQRYENWLGELLIGALLKPTHIKPK